MSKIRRSRNSRKLMFAKLMLAKYNVFKVPILVIGNFNTCELNIDIHIDIYLDKFCFFEGSW